MSVDAGERAFIYRGLGVSSVEAGSRSWRALRCGSWCGRADDARKMEVQVGAGFYVRQMAASRSGGSGP